MLMNILTCLGARHLARKTPALTIHNKDFWHPRLIFQILYQRGTTVNLEGHLLTMFAGNVTSSDFIIVANIRETQQYLTPYREESRAQGCTRLSQTAHGFFAACVCLFVSLGTDRFIYFLPVRTKSTHLPLH